MHFSAPTFLLLISSAVHATPLIGQHLQSRDVGFTCEVTSRVAQVCSLSHPSSSTLPVPPSRKKKNKITVQKLTLEKKKKKTPVLQPICVSAGDCPYVAFGSSSGLATGCASADQCCVRFRCTTSSGKSGVCKSSGGCGAS